MHLKKDRTEASVYKLLFMEIRNRYRDHIPVYTDGSRVGDSVVCTTIRNRNFHEIARFSITVTIILHTALYTL